MRQHHYKVFVSHGTGDRWVAAQIARSVRDLGADAFLDENDIPKGGSFKEIVQSEIASCDELLALFTPWSAKRSWVWIEIGAAWGQDKPVVAVFHGMEVRDLEQSGQGKGILEDINVLQLNHLEQYLAELAIRVNGVIRA